MEQTKAITVQDKNFTVRLKAAIEKKLKEAGVIEHMIFAPDEYSSKEDFALWKFMQSLDSITVNYLQGEEKDKDYLNKKDGKNG